MSAPLYNECHPPTACDASGNRGLWFERFFNQFDERNDWRIPKPQDNAAMNSSHWLKTHFKDKKAGNATQLTTHTNAQSKLVTALQGHSHFFKASGHFVTGMGNTHPVENGFAWHCTLGVPYLTGAAVKGLVRSYIETHLDASDAERQNLLLQWFGSTDKDPLAEGYQSQAGELIFFDALPTSPVTLTIDIMTPHMGKWYEKGGTNEYACKPEAVPADWHDPVPVTYLVAKDITLQFSFALRPCPQNPNTPIDLNDVLDVLERALSQMGAGGKTAVGYGAMVPDTAAEEARKIAVQNILKAEKVKQMTEAQRQIQAFIDYMQKRFEELRGKPTRENGVEHQKARELVKIARESPNWTTEEKRSTAEAIETWLPKVVALPKPKEEFKKLKLNALKDEQ